MEALVTHDATSREATAQALAVDLGVSRRTVLRALRKLRFRRVKPTFKPGLTAAMKKARLEFALAHRHWTLEDWKRVIWTDETSVILGHRRGTIRIWRRTAEDMDPTVIRRRWRMATDFMFWGCFTYDFKGPCHIWRKETAEERKRAQQILDGWNADLEPECRERWEAART